MNSNDGGPATDPFLRIEGVSKQFGQFTAVNNVSLSVEKGEIFALLGNLWFTAYLIQTIHRIQTVVEKECPSLLLEKKAKEDTSVEKKKD